MGLKSSEICPCLQCSQLALFQPTRTPGWCWSVQPTESETVGVQAQLDSPLLTERDPPLQLSEKTRKTFLGCRAASVYELIPKNPVLCISCHTAQRHWGPHGSCWSLPPRCPTSISRGCLWGLGPGCPTAQKTGNSVFLQLGTHPV